ncbi:MAG TPA: hypothetical protein VGQ99_22825 [Tepidisphaeraceae bacterium]|jgi:hypothetical protein|nr:hypothetical protein [Tepidisphaeraceae bacterium]
MKYTIPKNLGKVRVAKGLAHRWMVWNGKQGRGEFAIVCKDRKQAEQVARMINDKEHGDEIEVMTQ